MSVNRPSAACAVLVRNAQTTILDWLAWHLSLGFQRIFVIDAGSHDATERLVQPLTQDWPIMWDAPELPADLSPEERRSTLPRHTLSRMIGEEEWVTVLDADEYLVPDTDLLTLLGHGKNAAGIALNWCIYGTSGHRQRPRGSLVATYSYRAHETLPDHGFTRLLVRSSYLTSPEHQAAPEDLDIPAERLVTPNGTPVQEGDRSPHWEGGRISHFICPATQDAATLPPSLRLHFDRNDVHDPAPASLITAARHRFNALSRTLFNAGTQALRAMASQAEEIQKPPQPDPDLDLPDRAQRPGFFYERMRPSRKDQLLLVPQAAPPYGITRAFLLRSAEGSLLEADPAGSHRPVIAFIQEQNPRLLSLVARDEHDLTLGDIPCPYGMATVLSRRTHRLEIFSLPEEAGHGETLFEAVPLPDMVPPDFLPLPPLDCRQGLSLNGLLTWLETHPEARPQDIQRTLCLLLHEEALQLGQNIPELIPFLP
ncbi:hypothetical protein GS535_08590 [Saccharibacter sp. EH611]|uniref:glycosyltransferase family 2 protein n=1 Tax=Saccharibacter sp. EH611 TaxID=2689391 RepID=UPI001322A8C8|nr:glycosyltransferase family 2 protein [Saccharibacter sp. EH611]MXV36610.1 hypothetical protein [Saccharibacter sp. EH611]